MRATLQFVTILAGWVLACPAGGGTVEALTFEAAKQGHEEGWLEGYGDTLEQIERLDEALGQARQTMPEAGG